MWWRHHRIPSVRPLVPQADADGFRNGGRGCVDRHIHRSDVITITVSGVTMPCAVPPSGRTALIPRFASPKDHGYKMIGRQSETSSSRRAVPVSGNSPVGRPKRRDLPGRRCTTPDHRGSRRDRQVRPEQCEGAVVSTTSGKFAVTVRRAGESAGRFHANPLAVVRELDAGTSCRVTRSHRDREPDRDPTETNERAVVQLN